MPQPTHKRRQIIVNRPMQFKFVGILVAILICLSVLALTTVYLTMWATLQTFDLQHDPITLALFTTIGLSLAMEFVFIAPFVVWLGLILTHKVAGPLLRVHVALAKMTEGDFNITIKLRKGDALVDLADAVNSLALSLRNRLPR